MRKFIKTISPVFAFALLILIPLSNAQAKTITSMTVIESNGTIAIKGTAEDEVLAVAIMVYDETETNLITIETASVDEDNNFDYSIEVEKGTYVVKAADYDGGEYVTKKVSVGTTNENASTTSSDSKIPNTGDTIIIFVVLLVISVLGLGIAVLLKKRKINN